MIGEPQLVTSFADYKRMYGGYLSEAGYGVARFLTLCGGAVLRQRGSASTSCACFPATPRPEQ